MVKSNLARQLTPAAPGVPWQEFGSYLRTEREKRKLSQRQLAVRAGITKNYVSMLERSYGANLHGHPVQPSVRIVDALADALQLPLAEVRGKAGYTLEAPKLRAVQPEADFAAFSSVGLVFYEFKRLKPRQQKRLEAEIACLMEFVREKIRRDYPDELAHPE